MPSDNRDAPDPERRAAPKKAWRKPQVIESEYVARGVSKTDHSAAEFHYTTSFTNS